MARRKRMEAKYRARRTVLLLLVLALVGTGGWLMGKSNLFSPKTPEPEESQGEVESDVSTESLPEAISQPESEPQQEPEPVVARWNLLLVSAANPLPEDFKEPQLETITESYKVDARIAEKLRKMFAQAKADGINLILCSAYRPVDYQQTLFDNKVQEEMQSGKTEQEAIQVTASMIALPGTSEHHTGLAVDIVTPEYQVLDDGFAQTPAFGWLSENAHKYGFVLRYPQDKQEITKIIYEPWHYRYVGEENASIIRENGYCLEEYLYVTRNQRNQQQDTSEQQPESSLE